MAMPPKDGKLIYHLTSIDNLYGIFNNGLLSRNSVKEFDDIADGEIVNHREKYGLNDLVPFHFFALSPLHGSVQKANVDKKFCYITVRREKAKKDNFKILKQHPLSMKDCTPLDYIEGMREIDWEVMEKKDYTNHDCREVCLAECLANKCVMPIDFFSIIVNNEEDKATVEELRDKTVGKEGTFYINVQTYCFVKL